MTDKALVVPAGWLAAVGAVVVATGEFLMLYSPAGGYLPSEGHANFLHPSADRVHLGFRLGVLVVPVYILGYWHVSQCLAPAWRLARWGVVLLGGYTVGVGNFWLGSNAFVAAVVRAKAAHPAADGPTFDALLAEMDGLVDPILQFIRVTLVGLSLLFIACVATGRSAYPRWLALFSPGVLLGVVFLGYVLVPAVGGYFLPAAMNVAHTVFFTLCAATARRDRLG